MLTKTDNESAVRVLLPALDSPYPTIQEGALTALLSRRNTAGQSEILRRITSLPQHWKYIIRQHPGRLTGTMRDAVLGSDETLYHNACMAAVMFGDYDLIPSLLTAMEFTSQAKADKAAETLMQLVAQLYDEIADPNENDTRRDRRGTGHIVSCLETSVQRFGYHKRREVIQAFLSLSRTNNEVLNEILDTSHHVCHLVVIDVMSKSSHDGVIRLLLDYLDYPQIPTAVLSVVTNRCDVKFIRNFLLKVGRESSDVFLQNLKQIEFIAWLRNNNNIVKNLDEVAQCCLVQFITSSGMTRSQSFSIIENILLHGKPGGRREAAGALANFNGADVNALSLKALGDSDPQVQASILGQLRRRGIPGILPRLVAMLDSPHVAVRHAAREALTEFSFQRFVGTFDMMDDETRHSTGALVKKIDQQTAPLLRMELQSPVHSKRLRGLQIARVMDIADSMEDLIIDMLHDDDHILRAEAVLALAKCPSLAARSAIEKMLHDSSIAVQEAARSSLNEQS